MLVSPTLFTWSLCVSRVYDIDKITLSGTCLARFALNKGTSFTVERTIQIKVMTVYRVNVVKYLIVNIFLLFSQSFFIMSTFIILRFYR